MISKQYSPYGFLCHFANSTNLKFAKSIILEIQKQSNVILNIIVYFYFLLISCVFFYLSFSMFHFIFSFIIDFDCYLIMRKKNVNFNLYFVYKCYYLYVLVSPQFQCVLFSVSLNQK